MRRTGSAVLAVLAALAFVPAALAQPASRGEAPLRLHPGFLAGTAWLAAHLHDRGVVVLHVGRTDAVYRRGHIPGARFVPLAAVAVTVGGVPNEFPPERELAATFRRLGVGRSARIVIYGDDTGLLAARAWVALDLLGQSRRTALLDGGLARWRAEGRPLEVAVPSVTPAPFTPAWHPDRVVTARWVRRHLRDRGVLLLDARAPNLYSGATSAGHIPGARNLYWMSTLASPRNPVLDPPGTLHDRLLRPLGADARGVRTVVTYCHSGMQASFDYFVARYVGYRDVRLYDGSTAEWSALGFPMERSGR